MKQITSGGSTKIAQAAKDLNVTSVTIRRYLAEFNIETTSDENGVKVLPLNSMEELQKVRQLKEEGLTNPQVMEILEQHRVETGTIRSEQIDTTTNALDNQKQEIPSYSKKKIVTENELDTEEESMEELASDEGAEPSESVRLKHTLTCQTCGKVFEHLNPRLRDCLDCYRSKRKDRRRGGANKSVIQHPLAQQAAVTKVMQQTQTTTTGAITRNQNVVRNYRKATEETRQITANLKRRLERPDLLEGERRWLEQIYAYQLILHQGWRHLAEYKSNTTQQPAGNTDIL